MSFADLERGESSRGALLHQDDPSLLPARNLIKSLRIQILKIIGNNKGIRSLLDDLERPTKSNPQVDALKLQKLTELLSATTNLITSAARDIPELAKATQPPAASAAAAERLRPEIIALSSDIHRAKEDFQGLQNSAVGVQNLYQDRAKKARVAAANIGGGDDGQRRPGGGVAGDEGGQQALELQVQEQSSIPNSEIEYQRDLIRQRAAGIESIQQNITEVNQIFVQLDDLLRQQGDMVDAIEDNVEQMATNVESGRKEIIKADAYQRKAGKRMLCLMLVFIVVLAIVLLAVLS